jgi:hypothetical protein
MTMRTLLHVPADVINGAFYSASIGIAAGAIATILTHRMEDGLQAGFSALMIAGACFGRSIWRTYRPRPQQTIFFARRTSG